MILQMLANYEGEQLKMEMIVHHFLNTNLYFLVFQEAIYLILNIPR